MMGGKSVPWRAHGWLDVCEEDTAAATRAQSEREPSLIPLASSSPWLAALGCLTALVGFSSFFLFKLLLVSFSSS